MIVVYNAIDKFGCLILYAVFHWLLLSVNLVLSLSFAFFQRLTGQETDNLKTLRSLALEESKQENEEFNPGDDADSSSEEGPLQESCGLGKSISDNTSSEANY